MVVVIFLENPRLDLRAPVGERDAIKIIFDDRLRFRRGLLACARRSESGPGTLSLRQAELKTEPEFVSAPVEQPAAASISSAGAERE